MNILEQHIAELHAAQETFNSGIARVHELYADEVQRSRDKLLAALNGEPVKPDVFAPLPRIVPNMAELERELNEISPPRLSESA